MSERTAPRPPQVTLSGWAILVGSVIVLVSVYDTVANLRSIDTRDELQRMLSEPPLSGTGMSFERLLDVMHGASLVAGACAAAMAVLGAFVLRRHKEARIAVSVLAVPLFLCGLLVGGFAASMVAVAAVCCCGPAQLVTGSPVVRRSGPLAHRRRPRSGPSVRSRRRVTNPVARVPCPRPRSTRRPALAPRGPTVRDRGRATAPSRRLPPPTPPADRERCCPLASWSGSSPGSRSSARSPRCW
ncbi:hypothetical protein [Nocardioides alcanivorans]|uniref:hypothetical protein n=1 Tax=Nocardioides alcanivorans TaxID=2897352 RepID=UPI001F2C0230|nr:hypothetical protein [Nocardioides alcanivorans]